VWGVPNPGRKNSQAKAGQLEDQGGLRTIPRAPKTAGGSVREEGAGHHQTIPLTANTPECDLNPGRSTHSLARETVTFSPNHFAPQRSDLFDLGSQGGVTRKLDPDSQAISEVSGFVG
jgi:hypothetical protein